MLPVSPRELTSGSISSSAIDPYQILQIRRDATTAEIQHAYKRLALLHHPARRKHRTEHMQLFEVLAACYETLVDKEARGRCDMFLQDQEKATLQRTLSWKSNKSSGNSKKFGGLLSNGNTRMDDSGDNKLGFVSSMPSLAEMSSCASSSLDGSFLTQDGETEDWKFECVTESLQLDGQEQVEIFHSVDSFLPDNCEERCSSPATGDRSTLRPLRILHSQQPSWDEEDSAVLPNQNKPETPSFDSEIKQAWSSHSTDNSSGRHNTCKKDIHYTGAEIDRLFGGPLQLLFRARRWQAFKDPFEVFTEVFGSPLYGDVPATPVAQKKGPSIRTAFQVPPPMEKLPSEHVNRLTTIHRARRVALGKEIVRTAVVRIDPSTGQRHVTISVTTEDIPVPEEEDPHKHYLFWFLDSLCSGSSVDLGKTKSGDNRACFCFDFSICT